MKIMFDLDGTLAAMYNVDGWLEMLMNEDVTPYAEAEPMFNVEQFAALCEQLVIAGYTLGVISWTARNGSKEYNREVRKVKKAWCEKYCPQLLNDFHVVKYGTPKHYIAKGILVDDEQGNRDRWHGATIDPTCGDFMKKLEALL
ncbi:MAG: hypothetical protein HUJ99_01395 [Bacteroidaceae bacterium]|nr:hypothetical protein [Bacteroidaceae bacterium]